MSVHQMSIQCDIGIVYFKEVFIQRTQHHTLVSGVNIRIGVYTSINIYIACLEPFNNNRQLQTDLMFIGLTIMQ